MVPILSLCKWFPSKIPLFLLIKLMESMDPSRWNKKFFKGPGGPDSNPVDIWLIERSNSRVSDITHNSSSMYTMVDEAEFYRPFLHACRYKRT